MNNIDIWPHGPPKPDFRLFSVVGDVLCKSDKPSIIIIIIITWICFPTPGRGLPYGSGLGLSRCLGPGECRHSFNDDDDDDNDNNE